MTGTSFPNGLRVGTNDLELQSGYQIVTNTAVFIGGTADARGDYDGTGNPTTVFTVTGDVLVQIFAKCTTNLTGANATLEVGVTGNTAALIAQSTGTDIDAGTIWRDVSPAVGAEAINGAIAIVGGLDIIETVATANLTAGALTYYCLWLPLSSDGNVEAA